MEMGLFLRDHSADFDTINHDVPLNRLTERHYFTTELSMFLLMVHYLSHTHRLRGYCTPGPYF